MVRNTRESRAPLSRTENGKRGGTILMNITPKAIFRLNEQQDVLSDQLTADNKEILATALRYGLARRP